MYRANQAPTSEAESPHEPVAGVHPLMLRRRKRNATPCKLSGKLRLVRRFWEHVTEPILRQRSVRRVVEIGSQAGESTLRLLELCAELGAHADVIDPLAPANYEELAPRFAKHGRFHQARSLEVLGSLPVADAYLIDGDHNWYTVYHELLAIDDRAVHTNSPRPVILMHDVGWPYAYRDLYYEASDIPEGFKHESLRAGLFPDQREAVANDGLNRHLEHARHEGGERNGVRAAVDDFLVARPNQYRWSSLAVFHGYGFLVPVADLDQPYAKTIWALCNGNPRLLALADVMERWRVAEHIKLESARHEARARTQELKTQREELKAQIAKLSQREDALKRRCDRLQNQLTTIERSRGYRMLETLRHARRSLQRIRGRITSERSFRGGSNDFDPDRN